MTLLGAVNEKLGIMTVQIALRVFAGLVCIFVFIRNKIIYIMQSTLPTTIYVQNLSFFVTEI